MIVNMQSSIKINDIYFDPFKIEEEYKDARIVFITHSHYDHFDMDSIRKVVGNNSIIVIPNDEEMIRKLDGYNYMTVSPDEEYEVCGIKFKTISSYNVNKPFHRKEDNFVGYVVSLDKVYYVMGDTDITEEAKKVKCDYLFIPIGGTYTMDYKEASVLTNLMKPKEVTPIHYGSIVGDKSYGDKFRKLVDKNIKVNILL